MDGNYLVTIVNGTKLEGFDATLSPRHDYAMHNMKNNTATWRGMQYSAPTPVLAKKDDKRRIATSVLRAANPNDSYWSDTIDCEQLREDARVKQEKVDCCCYVALHF